MTVADTQPFLLPMPTGHGAWSGSDRSLAVSGKGTRTPSGPDTCASAKAGVSRAIVSDVLFAIRGYLAVVDREVVHRGRRAALVSRQHGYAANAGAHLAHAPAFRDCRSRA